MRKRLQRNAVIAVSVVFMGMTALTVVPFPFATPVAQAAPSGGPVIIGGDDTPDHGSAILGASPPTLQAGWIYIKLALNSLLPNVTRTNDGSIALIGSCPTTTFDPSAVPGDGNAGVGGAYDLIRTQLTGGTHTVTFVEGGTAIDTFFTNLHAGTVNPAIVVISGNQTGNDLDDDCGNSPANPNPEVEALTDNAAFLANFVNEGGGLLSHGTEFGWLSALFPSVSANNNATTSTIHITTDGAALWPGLTDSDVSSPWHAYFEGDLGSLQVLGQAASDSPPNTPITETNGAKRGVIIGGTSVTLPVGIIASPSNATPATGTQVCINALVTDGVGGAGNPIAGAAVHFAVSGANTRSGSAVSAADGTAQFCYVGFAPGADTVIVDFTSGGMSGQTQTAVTFTGPAIAPPSHAHAGDQAIGVENGSIVTAPTYDPIDPVVGAAITGDAGGSWSVTANGGVFAAGNAQFFGSAVDIPLEAPIIDIVPTPDDNGYYLVSRDGGVFAFGDAQFYGSMANANLNQPITGIASTCTGDGYYLVGGDGGVFTFGGALFHGSMGGVNLNREMFGIIPNCAGDGYWTIARDGGVFTFGNADFYGSLGSTPPASGTIAMVPTDSGLGYWLVDGEKHVHKFGDAN